MNALEEFDQKLSEATNQLTDLVDNTKQVKTINELLEKTDEHWKDSLEKLSVAVESIQAAGGTLSDTSKSLIEAIRVLEAADPGKVISIIEDLNYKLEGKISSIQGEISNLRETIEKERSLNQKKIDDNFVNLQKELIVNYLR